MILQILNRPKIHVQAQYLFICTTSAACYLDFIVTVKLLLSSKGWHPNRVVSFVNSLFICWIRVKKCPLTSRNWDSSHVTGGQILLLSYLKKLFCRTVWNFYLMWKWLLGFLCVFILRSYLTAFGILSQKPRLILELVFLALLMKTL